MRVSCCTASRGSNCFCNRCYCRFPLVVSQRGSLNLISVQSAELCFHVRGSRFKKQRHDNNTILLLNVKVCAWNVTYLR